MTPYAMPQSFERQQVGIPEICLSYTSIAKFGTTLLLDVDALNVSGEIESFRP